MVVQKLSFFKSQKITKKAFKDQDSFFRVKTQDLIKNGDTLFQLCE